MRIVFDVETTTKNKGHPFTKSNKLVAYSVIRDTTQTTHYYDELDFITGIRCLAVDNDELVGFNIKFDLHWAVRSGFKIPNKIKIWDCQIAQFLIEGQQNRYPSLNDALAYHKLPAKIDKIKEYWDLGVDTTDIPKDELLPYVTADVSLTSQLEQAQRSVMTPKQIRLCEIMGLDLLTLLDMEQAGIKLDRDKCDAKCKECSDELATLNDSLYRAFDFVHGNLDSDYHLSALLFGGAIEVDFPTYMEQVYKSGAHKGETYLKTLHDYKVYQFQGLFTPEEKNKSKRVSKIEGQPEYTVYFTNEEVLKQLPCRSKVQKEVITNLLRRAEVSKLINTYYGALPTLINTMEWEDNMIHGSYNQCVAATGRLSSTKPNMQNFSSEVDEILVSRYE